MSGCFDLLHSGHIAFLREAASYGDLYVALGSDATVFDLKGRLPINNEQERRFMVGALDCVKEAFISSGSGILDFVNEMRAIKPDIFVVNEDGNTPQKEALCREEGIEYIVLRRVPYADLPARSTTDLRRINLMPYRIDLAGGWLDQPFVSQTVSRRGHHRLARTDDCVQRAQRHGDQHAQQRHRTVGTAATRRRPGEAGEGPVPLRQPAGHGGRLWRAGCHRHCDARPELLVL
ncbi:MAG: adenylyltransferase/cytidyltransferase family protein [Deltaproteobacteria bacterium]|nr:adenylyltransferase/cytidyltransferase family protein [Deltaproteobacteria bacterium]